MLYDMHVMMDDRERQTPASDDEYLPSEMDGASTDWQDSEVGDDVEQLDGLGSKIPRGVQGVARRPATDVCYHDHGRRTHLCPHCKARLFKAECDSDKGGKSLCCHQGASTSLKGHFKKFPEPLRSILAGPREDVLAKAFYKNPRLYNSALQMASSVIQIPRTEGLQMLSARGSVYHLLNPLQPNDDAAPQFVQIYMIDDEEEQMGARLNALKQGQKEAVDRELLGRLQHMLNECNPYVHTFKTVWQHLDKTDGSSVADFKITFVESSSDDQRRYNAPTASEMAVLIPGSDGERALGPREARLCLKGPGAQARRISDLDPHYEPLHFVLLYPHGEEGWHKDMVTKQGKKLTALQFTTYFLHDRPEGEDESMFRRASRLFQEWVLEGFIKVESERVGYFRTNDYQGKARSCILQGMVDALRAGETDAAKTGKIQVLPSSHVGSPRYYIKKYHDAMALVRVKGKPDLFITMTCNPKWPEIKEELRAEEAANDRPDLVDRVFHMKLKQLEDDVKKRQVFGPVKGYVYSVEFQKRGLPHAHMLVILEDGHKPQSPEDIDSLAQATIPDPDKDPALHSLVTAHMLHGPCGPRCLDQHGNCRKHFPMEFNERTHLGPKGFTVYRCPDNGRTFR